MPAVRVESQPWEERLYRDDYAALSSDLAELGFTVIEPRRSYETRAIPQAGGALHVSIAVALYLAEHVDDAVVDAVIALMIARLRKRRRRDTKRYPRRAVIYGPRKEVLGEVELDEVGDDE